MEQQKSSKGENRAMLNVVPEPQWNCSRLFTSVRAVAIAWHHVASYLCANFRTPRSKGEQLSEYWEKRGQDKLADGKWPMSAQAPILRAALDIIGNAGKIVVGVLMWHFHATCYPSDCSLVVHCPACAVMFPFDRKIFY